MKILVDFLKMFKDMRISELIGLIENGDIDAEKIFDNLAAAKDDNE